MVSIILSRTILSYTIRIKYLFFSNHRWLSDVRSLRQAMSFGSSSANKRARHCEQYKTKTQEWSPADRSPIQNKQIPKGLQRMKNDHNDINTKAETHLKREHPWLCEVGHDTDGNREQTRGVLRHTQGALKIGDWFSLEFFFWFKVVWGVWGTSSVSEQSLRQSSAWCSSERAFLNT